MELKIEHLSKQFKDKTAVNDVSLTLTPGVWGLLGANGAGKTTLMRMIADIMTPTNGAVYYDGKDIRELGEVPFRKGLIAILNQIIYDISHTLPLRFFYS